MQNVKKKVSGIKNSFLGASFKKKALIIVVLLIAVYGIYSFLKPKKSAYTYATVKRSTVSDTISETGNVASSGRFDVYSNSTGYIEEVYVANGTIVAAGQELFKVKSTATEQEKASAYAAYASALATKNTTEQNKPLYQSQLETARQSVINASNVVNEMNDNRNNGRNNPATKKAYTQEEIDSINSALISARQNFIAVEKKYLDADTNIMSGRAGLTSAWLAYQATQDSVVKATAPGVIANFSASVGDKVTAVSATSAAASSTIPALVILGDFAKTSIRIPLNEVDVNKVKIGHTASIVFDAFREKKYTGHISTIDTAGTNTNGVITYNAYVIIDNPDANVKTEMTATVTVETAKHTNVLVVPNSAVKPYKGGKAVVVDGITKDNQVKSKDGKALPLHYVPVKTGLKGITQTEIRSGISEGTKVVTSSIN